MRRPPKISPAENLRGRPCSASSTSNSGHSAAGCFDIFGAPFARCISVLEESGLAQRRHTFEQAGVEMEQCRRGIFGHLPRWWQAHSGVDHVGKEDCDYSVCCLCMLLANLSTKRRRRSVVLIRTGSTATARPKVCLMPACRLRIPPQRRLERTAGGRRNGQT